MGRKRRRKTSGELTTIAITQSTHRLLDSRKEKKETFEDFIRRILGVGGKKKNE